MPGMTRCHLRVVRWRAWTRDPQMVPETARQTVADQPRGSAPVILGSKGGQRVAALGEVGFGDGARLVELAPLTDPVLVPGSVGQALGVSERDAPTPVAGLVRQLADRELLVVLDNCEHVLEAAAGLMATLLAQCRRVRFLATSRERLDVPGELVFPVPPLGVPANSSAAAVAASEAGMLFATRAGAASPGFELTAHNSAAVAAVCARLDGIPWPSNWPQPPARPWAPLSWPHGWTAILGC